MAQLLIFQRDNTHSDPVINEQDCYKTGDVIVVADDSHVFSSAEHQQPFKVVSVAGTKADYDYLTDPAPATIRDKYPRSMLQIKRLQTAMIKTVRADGNRRRKYTADNIGSAEIKIIGGV